jgi:hypothetical protein
MSEITNEDIRSICTCPKTIDGYLSYTADNCMIHNSRYMLKVVRDKDKRIVELELMVDDTTDMFCKLLQESKAKDKKIDRLIRTVDSKCEYIEELKNHIIQALDRNNSDIDKYWFEKWVDKSEKLGLKEKE